ncbi:hypothetical protein [Actinoplanes sp. NPDC049802]
MPGPRRILIRPRDDRSGWAVATGPDLHGAGPQHLFGELALAQPLMWER